jgi:hypothetical protein
MQSERRVRLEAAGWQFADTPEDMFEQWWGKSENQTGEKTMNILGMAMRESPNGVRAVCVEVGPREAAHLLKYNTHNRARSAVTEERYTEDMLRDRFLVSAAGIGVTEEPTIADGQSRLYSIIASGKTVPMVIVTGLPVASHGVHDRQRKRQLFYALAESKQIPEPDKNGVQVATLLASRYECGYHAPSDSQVADRYNMQSEAIKQIHRHCDSHESGVGQAGVRAALVMAYEKHPEKAVEFCKLLFKETHERPDHPAFRLRKTLKQETCTRRAKGKKGGGGGRQQWSFEATLYAFNAFANGRWISSVRSAKEVE